MHGKRAVVSAHRNGLCLHVTLAGSAASRLGSYPASICLLPLLLLLQL